MPLHEYVVVDDPRELPRTLARLGDLPSVGVDVERADWDRYYRAAALVQVGGAGRVAIIDPLALDDLGPLQAFLTSRVTVLHAMENDLGPLAVLGVAPTRLHDTAIAAALLGLPTGLETLLAELLGIVVTGDKAAMQRANWEARPLREDMLRYAAGDVADLPALWDVLAEQLEEAGRFAWYEQELQAALDLPTVQERRDWTRTRGAGRLSGAQRARLRALWEVREELGRASDTAPGRIATDKALVALATDPPTDVGGLARRGVRRQAVKTFGRELIAALEAGGQAAPENPQRGGRRLTEQDHAIADRLRALRAERAQELGLDPGILCPSRTLLGAVIAEPHDATALRELLGLRPWQWEILAEDFCDALGVPPPGRC